MHGKLLLAGLAGLLILVDRSAQRSSVLSIAAADGPGASEGGLGLIKIASGQVIQAPGTSGPPDPAFAPTPPPALPPASAPITPISAPLISKPASTPVPAGSLGWAYTGQVLPSAQKPVGPAQPIMATYAIGVAAGIASRRTYVAPPPPAYRPPGLIAQRTFVAPPPPPAPPPPAPQSGGPAVGFRP